MLKNNLFQNPLRSRSQRQQARLSSPKQPRLSRFGILSVGLLVLMLLIVTMRLDSNVPFHVQFWRNPLILFFLVVLGIVSHVIVTLYLNLQASMSITDEQAHRTWDLLLLSNLRLGDILWSKFLNILNNTKFTIASLLLFHILSGVFVFQLLNTETIHHLLKHPLHVPLLITAIGSISLLDCLLSMMLSMSTAILDNELPLARYAMPVIRFITFIGGLCLICKLLLYKFVNLSFVLLVMLGCLSYTILILLCVYVINLTDDRATT